MTGRLLIAALSALTVVTVGCGADETAETLPEIEVSAADRFAAADESAAVAVGESSVHETGAANDAIAFEATELFSQSARSGLDLLGSGATIVTFVQPGCDFSVDQSTLLVDAAAGDIDVTYVFIHSGGSAASFMAFATDADLVQENMVHLDDADGVLSQRFGVDAYPSTLLVDGDGRLSSSTGALDEVRLQRALDIVTSPTAD